jgi:hypothetical protein
MRIFLALVYLAVIVLYTALTKFSVGLPLRTLALVFLAALIFVSYYRQSLDLLARHGAIYWAFFALAVIGTLLTYYYERSAGSTFDGLTANIVQPYLIFYVVLMLIPLIGLWPVVLITLSGAALTGTVAVLQYLDVEIAWRLREITSEIQHEPAAIQNYVTSRERALGVSLSPILFSYHMMCTYVILNILYRFRFMGFFNYYAGCFLVAVATLANGTRSVLLGMAVSEVALELRRGTARSLLKVALIILAAAALYVYAQATGSRIAETQDASALGRVVLFNYGIRLAIDNPLGLGWDFNPAGYAWLYWEHLSDFVNADGVFRLGLHNAYLNYFLTYGVAGTAVAVLALLYDPRYVFLAGLFFSSYLVHIIVHNNGMFIGDYYFWFAFAIMMNVFGSHGIVYGGTVRPQPAPVFATRRQPA